jgi:hypothetical protein
MVKGPSSTKLLIGCSLLSKATTGQAVARRCQPEDDDHGTWTTEVRPATRRPSRRWYGKAYLSAWRRRSMPSTRVLLLNPHHEGRIGHRQLCRGLDEQPRQPRLRGQRPRLQPCQTFCAHSRCGPAPWEWRDGIRTSCGFELGNPFHAGPRLERGAIAQGRVQALPIVEDFDVVEHGCPGFLTRAEAGVVDVLLLE